MPVLIFIDQSEGQVKKASIEAVCYGAAVAKQTGDTAEGVILGKVTDDIAALGKYGPASSAVRWVRAPRSACGTLLRRC